MGVSVHAKWLLDVPVSDGNFKTHLKEISDNDLSELNQLLQIQLEVGFKVKSKVEAIQKELKKRNILVVLI